MSTIPEQSIPSPASAPSSTAVPPQAAPPGGPGPAALPRVPAAPTEVSAAKHEVKAHLSPDERSRFMKAILRDLRAMEQMLEEGRFESGICRIGAEQEMVLIDRDWQPRPAAMEILADIEDPRVTTEVARFNLECNVAPRVFTGAALREMEAELNEVVALTRAACRRHGADVVFTGILPTLAKEHLTLTNIADRPRYFALNDAITAARGGSYELNLQGIDELTVTHDNVLLEALNTSFQVHYQVEPALFALQYNLAQALAAPVLSCAANSPMLFGRRLWRETRIAIFQQTVDARGRTPFEREFLGRVRFGERWIDASPLEIYRADISRLRIILGREENEDPFGALDAGRAPKLQALGLFNSTIYRWNRLCYGVSDGRPHLRIENRLLPAGPTILDEMANGAFWWGLMHEATQVLGDVTAQLQFDEARSNFLAAARQGMHAEFLWLGGRYISARDLILNELLPMSRAGLVRAAIDSADIERLLGVIEERVRTRRTGAQWLLSSAAEMRNQGSRAERLAALTAGIFHRQHPQPGVPVHPVHEWSTAYLDEGGGWTRNFQRVGQYMTTELFTVQPDDTLDLVISLMDWERVRHVPVEDSSHRLVGIVTYRAMLTYLARQLQAGRLGDPASIPVTDIMRKDPVTVTPTTSTLDGIRLMREHKVSCLPVVQDGRLVGLITEHDFMRIAGQLLEQQLRTAPPDAGAPETT